MPQMESAGPVYLGVDLSTQSVTAVLVEGPSLDTILQLETVNFDADLPKYGTKNGMHVAPQGGRVTSPVMMWLEALDLVFAKLKPELLARVVAVSGSAQQHGSVYWNAEAADKLRSMDVGCGLARNLIGSFALDDCPIWADNSTQYECDAIEAALGGSSRVCGLTGSRACARFTGPQIARISRTRPGVYASTTRISLVSSFLSTLLVGRFAPLDVSDASGMNLLELWTGQWSDDMLEATAPDLRHKLGSVVPSFQALGPVSPYLASRFGLPRDCVVVPATGDNPSSLVGMGLGEVGDVMVSLGTSDTLIGLTSSPHPCEEGHVMASPRAEGEWFAMLCYKNGALAREWVRDEYCGGSWESFSQALAQGSPGNEGCLGLYLRLEEIVPPLPYKGTFRVDAQGERVSGFGSASKEVRGVVEGRFLSMRLHATQLGIPSPKRILATGGGAMNKDMMQVLSDVFNAEVYVAPVSDSAALGAAYRAAHALACRKHGGWVPMVGPSQTRVSLLASPRPQAVSAYSEALLQRLAHFETPLGHGGPVSHGNNTPTHSSKNGSP